MSSGDDIEAGRVTTAESTTDLLGAVPSEQDVDFNGVVILRVGPQLGDLHPNITLDGIHGVGGNGTAGPIVRPGGTGVIGFGGQNDGTGVLGFGGGLNGGGGLGLHGIGGSQFAFPSFDPNAPPGAGLLAQGGRMDDDSNFPRLSHGAGVIAVAGGRKLPDPPFVDTGSVGVYAQGANADVRTVNIDNVDTLVGPIAPGVGVLGRGGVPVPRESPLAAGVVGLAGDTAIPPISESGDAGVYGAGPTGVFGHGQTGVTGHGITGPGVLGVGDVDRGGVFRSARSAAVQLIPRHLKGLSPDGAAVTPMANPVGVMQSALPKDGRSGDLMAIEMEAVRNTRACTLWFCVQSATDTTSARWAQVLVGPAVDGVA